MKKHILCLGDSNTHGYCADPADCADGGIRFNEDERWTKLLQKYLGEDYLVIEEGLSGRTTCFSDPLFEGLSALEYIHPCLKSHEPIDLLIIMLGTNDTKDRFCASGACIGLICGFFGAGGGMMMLMVLTVVLGYELKTAVGTSVFVMTFSALTGTVSHFALASHMPRLDLLAMCVVFTLIWAQIAAKIATRADARLLNRLTGVILTVLGIILIVISFW